MSFKLTPDDMVKLAGKIRDVGALGVQVQTFLFGSESGLTHTVVLGWEGPDEVFFVGITAGTVGGKIGQVLRDSGGKLITGGDAFSERDGTVRTPR